MRKMTTQMNNYTYKTQHKVAESYTTLRSLGWSAAAAVAVREPYVFSEGGPSVLGLVGHLLTQWPCSEHRG